MARLDDDGGQQMIFDLIAAHQPSAGGSIWTPADLFKNGEVGYWFDASDYSTLFQDAAGATPVTASGQSVGLWKNKIAGQTIVFDISQSTASARPSLNITSGKYSVVFDGVDDLFRFSNSGDLTAISCVNGIGLASGFTMSTVASGAVLITNTPITQIVQRSYGLVDQSALGQNVRSTNQYVANVPNTTVVTAKPDTNAVIGRLNGVAATGGTPSQALITFRSNKVLEDCQTLTKLSQFVFVNRLLTAGEITLLETFIASKQ